MPQAEPTGFAENAEKGPFLAESWGNGGFGNGFSLGSLSSGGGLGFKTNQGRSLFQSNEAIYKAQANLRLL